MTNWIQCEKLFRRNRLNDIGNIIRSFVRFAKDVKQNVFMKFIFIIPKEIFLVTFKRNMKDFFYKVF